MHVALRKESVDRNCVSTRIDTGHNVALRKESVDRNIVAGAIYWHLAGSLSARRAWIEIFLVATPAVLVTVALRKESVDRN